MPETQTPSILQQAIAQDQTKGLPQQEGETGPKIPTKMAPEAQVKAPTPNVPASFPMNPAPEGEDLTLPENWESAAKAQFDKVRDFYKKYAGQVGCNPYFYWRKAVLPLLEMFETRNSRFEWEALDPVTKQAISITQEQWNKRLFSAIMRLECKEGYAMHDPAAYQAEQDRRKAVLSDLQAGRKQIIVQ